jgi:hypothetical protein
MGKKLAQSVVRERDFPVIKSDNLSELLIGEIFIL